MSALGHKQTHSARNDMCALPPESGHRAFIRSPPSMCDRFYADLIHRTPLFFGHVLRITRIRTFASSSRHRSEINWLTARLSAWVSRERNCIDATEIEIAICAYVRLTRGFGVVLHRSKSTGVNVSLPALSLSALGVVFGDIGTSPLYTLKTVFDLVGGKADLATALGLLSLVIWTLIVVVTIKYVSFAMRVDNDGEGGILALMALLGVKRQHRPAIIAVGLFGAALIYGYGAITPAISVLSALEGLEIVLPAFASYVVPVAVLILVALFAIQPQGTSRIGRAFGPIMALWFATIALLGIWGISQNPSVLLAIDPRQGLSCLISGGAKGFLVLGGVFL